MVRHKNERFEGQHVVLDGGVFCGCAFKNCSLEYSGGDVDVRNCRGESCQFVWRDAAQRTVALLKALGLFAEGEATSPPPIAKIQ